MPKSLDEELDALVRLHGANAVLSAARRVEQLDDALNVCTILVNVGVHSMPEYLLNGEVYVFYEGSVDLSSEKNLKEFTDQKILSLREFLRTKKWNQIYIVISGHAAMCMQVKLAVYRITHIETVDWVFDGAGRYLKLEVPMRKLLSQR